MINEMISAVSEAEENAAEIIARAKQNSVDAVELAEKDAEKEILDAINTGRSQLEDNVYRKKLEIKEREAAVETAIQNDVEEIKKSALKKKYEAIEEVKKNFYWVAEFAKDVMKFSDTI